MSDETVMELDQAIAVMNAAVHAVGSSVDDPEYFPKLRKVAREIYAEAFALSKDTSVRTAAGRKTFTGTVTSVEKQATKADGSPAGFGRVLITADVGRADKGGGRETLYVDIATRDGSSIPEGIALLDFCESLVNQRVTFTKEPRPSATGSNYNYLVAIEPEARSGQRERATSAPAEPTPAAAPAKATPPASASRSQSRTARPPADVPTPASWAELVSSACSTYGLTEPEVEELAVDFFHNSDDRSGMKPVRVKAFWVHLAKRHPAKAA